MRPTMRVVFMGAPDFATPALRAILEHGHEVVAVYTRAPQPAGRRGLELTKTPVHRLADDFGLPVVTAATLRSAEAQETFRAFAADVAVVVAYGLILPPPVLAAPRLGCLNLHASLLPRWRGAAPIQRAIMAGDAETGVDLMRMEAGLDTGPVAREIRTPIRPDETAGELAGAARRARRAVDRRIPARARRRIVSSFVRRAPRARPTRIRSTRAKRRSTGAPTPSRCATTSTASRPRPARTARLRSADAWSGSRFFAPKSSNGPARPAPSSTRRWSSPAATRRSASSPPSVRAETAMSGAELMRGAKLDVGARFNPSAPPRSER